VLASYHRGELVDTTGRTRGFIDSKQSELGFRDQAGERGARSSRHRPPPDGTVGVAASGTTLKLPDERNGLVFVFRCVREDVVRDVMSATRPIYIGDIVQTP
jgi:hypothetical protein